MQTKKYRAVGSEVQAVEVTEKNVAEVADEFGATLFTSPRDGTQYGLLETPDGTSRIQPGGAVVTKPDGTLEVFTTGEAFSQAYERA